MRDVSVTADCADIDPSLVPSLPETLRVREKHEDSDIQRDCEAIAEQKRWKERQKEKRRGDCLSPLVSSDVFFRAHCTVCTC